MVSIEVRVRTPDTADCRARLPEERIHPRDTEESEDREGCREGQNVAEPRSANHGGDGSEAPNGSVERNGRCQPETPEYNGNGQHRKLDYDSLRGNQCRGQKIMSFSGEDQEDH